MLGDNPSIELQAGTATSPKLSPKAAQGFATGINSVAPGDFGLKFNDATDATVTAGPAADVFHDGGTHDPERARACLLQSNSTPRSWIDPEAPK